MTTTTSPRPWGDLPAWGDCDDCENPFCNVHNMHAHDCPCPPVDEWETDPYTQPDHHPDAPPD